MIGVERGPVPHSSPKAGATGTLQSSLPVDGAIARATSLPPCRSRKTRRSPAIAGEENPPPRAIFQMDLSSFGRAVGTRASPDATPLLDGPRHCGQSSAETAADHSAERRTVPRSKLVRPVENKNVFMRTET